MPKLKLPRAPEAPSPELPPELRWEADAARSFTVLLGRRQFLKALVVLLGAFAAPVTGVRRAAARARGRFFTGAERATLEALCDFIIPPDAEPGATALGAVRYIEGMLTALDGRPRVFAGGPFSGRTPFPDNRNGTPSRRRPRNAFKRFIPLTRLQELRWRAELFGSASMPGVTDFNDAALGPLPGLRDVYRSGLAKIEEVAVAVAGARFGELAPADQERVFAMLPAAFQPDPRRGGLRFHALVIMHTIEGCFSVPEYGGNRRLAGWRMVGLEGDDQPLGYSIFSRAADGYNERADHPMSTPNPDEIEAPRPLTADGEAVQRLIIQLTGGFGE